jgi:hypothetical protein
VLHTQLTSIGIEHVPFVAQHPAECAELAVDHAPPEVVPGTEVFQSVSLFDFAGTIQRTFPDVVLNRPSCMILDGKRLLSGTRNDHACFVNTTTRHFLRASDRNQMGRLPSTSVFAQKARK